MGLRTSLDPNPAARKLSSGMVAHLPLSWRGTRGYGQVWNWTLFIHGKTPHDNLRSLRFSCGEYQWWAEATRETGFLGPPARAPPGIFFLGDGFRQITLVI